MGCDKVNLDGVTAIVCRRGKPRRRANCSVPGCNREHTKLCDFPLAGRSGSFPAFAACDSSLAGDASRRRRK